MSLFVSGTSQQAQILLMRLAALTADQNSASSQSTSSSASSASSSSSATDFSSSVQVSSLRSALISQLGTSSDASSASSAVGATSRSGPPPGGPPPGPSPGASASASSTSSTSSELVFERQHLALRAAGGFEGDHQRSAIAEFHLFDFDGLDRGERVILRDFSERMEPVGVRHGRIPLGAAVGGQRGGERKRDGRIDVSFLDLASAVVVGQRERFRFGERERLRLAVASSRSLARPAERPERDPKRFVIEVPSRLVLELGGASWGDMRLSDHAARSMI